LMEMLVGVMICSSIALLSMPLRVSLNPGVAIDGNVVWCTVLQTDSDAEP
jgi:hypothetical protein